MMENRKKRNLIKLNNIYTNDDENNLNENENEKFSKKMERNESVILGNFKVLYLLTQLVGLTLIILMTSWIFIHMGGFSWSTTPQFEFNWHPFLMTFAMIFLYGNSILIYRGLRQTRKKTLKLTHATIHGIAFILIVIALQAVFDSHNLAKPSPIPNLYSLHSWLGLGAVILFSGQWIGGFITFLLPGMKISIRESVMPWHIYFGLLGFILAIASALMGLTEKAIFSVKGYSTLPNSGLILNVMGVLMVIFGGLVVYLATEPSYKRKPLPEDAMLLTNTNE